MIGFNKSRVGLAWEHPNYPTAAFTYLISIRPLRTGTVREYPLETYLREEAPHISIDLKGFECKTVEIRVAVYGEEEEGVSVNATLPSCEFVCVHTAENETASLLMLL